MPAFDFNWIFEWLLAVFTRRRGAILFNRLEKFLSVLFLGQFWIVDSFPSFSLLLLELLFQFPAGLDIGSVMKIETAVSERAVARVMPVFADILNVIESAGVFDGRVQPGGAHDLFIGILCVYDIVSRKLIVCIGIHPSINLTI